MTLLKSLKKRFSDRPDTEHQQAFVRLIVGLCMTAYFLPGEIAEADLSFVHGNIAFLIAITAIPIWILIDPRVNPLRRVLGMVIDMAALGSAMILSGSHGIALYVLYLWVTAGNGFRYGSKYLFIALCLGLLSLAFVGQHSEAFIENRILVVELMVGYAFFMGYVNSLVKQLYQAVDTAQSASKAKQTFLSTMSHELRTPLHAIAGLTALLKAESAKQNKSLDLLGSVETAVSQMLSIVNDILDFSKIEAGKAEIVRAQVDLDALNISIMKMFRGQAQQKDLRFTAYFSSQLPAFFASDETRLRQILSNILSNSIKFTDKGEISLAVDFVTDKRGVPCVKWSIKDTGIGMSEETIAKIFESFTQADASTSRKYGGTGLGTTIAREFVLLLGGEIGIDSTLGKGTTFWFTIPAIGHSNPDFTTSKSTKAPVLALVPEQRSDVIDLCRAHHGLTYTKSEVIDREISKDDVEAVCLVVLPEAGQLPPLAHYAATKGMKVIVIDESSTEERKREFIRLGAFSICKQVSALPRALRMAQLSSGSTEVATAAAIEPTVSGKRILIADDNLTNLQILSAILEMHSHIVTQAKCGEDALEMIVDHDFDMFIFDMNMPDITGLELTKIMRAMGYTSKPVAILTADATPEAEHATKESGANLFITKPVSPEALLEKVSSMFADKTLKNVEAQPAPAKEYLVLNQEALNQVLKVSPSPDFVNILVSSYLGDSKENMKRLTKAYDDKDYGLWRSAVHAMKGSACNLHLECLVHVLDIAHELSPQEFAGNCQNIFAHIQKEAQRAEAALLAAAGSSKIE